MIAVIFEGKAQSSLQKEYLDLSGQLRPVMDQIEGFISVERFQSLADPEKVLSLSFWKDEEGIRQLRDLELHRIAETRGKEAIFSDYRIRVAEVTRDYGLLDRKEAPPELKPREKT
ncbi:MAG TPA: antibiotic biosynthesis monooxygenase [Chitinophagaceae bacterium]|nr:antibiotic biosynthesis monooxygenase [Chitinophagaceae bacterium]